MHKTGLEDYYVIKNNKKLRMGYTTGSCAAAAAGGAVHMLLSGEEIFSMCLHTPKGIDLDLELLDTNLSPDEVSCAVRKDGGDDPDATNGILIYAHASKRSDGKIVIDGGKGVGRVTKPGLTQKIGEAAINKVPMEMIRSMVEKECEQFGYKDGIQVIISVPEGEKVAEKTFNPRLGILGGISILGTSGIVEPMSEAALIHSIQVEMKQKLALNGEYLLVTPGNYGAEYLREHMDLPFEQNMKCSNYVGETIDLAIEHGAKGILFISHIGKFVKVGAGIMNTHSHHADARMEVLAACALRCGCSGDTAREVLNCNTTDEALVVLKEQGILEDTMKILMKKIQFYLEHRSYEKILMGAVIFLNEQGMLGMTDTVPMLIEKINQQKKLHDIN